MTAVEFTGIPATTGEFRAAMDVLSGDARMVANALSESGIKEWQSAIQRCLVGEGLTHPEAYKLSGEAANQIREALKYADLLSKHAEYSVGAIARLDRAVTVVRDERNGQTFKVES